MLRAAACNCGQLRLTCEGQPIRVSMCHCLECQRRTGAVFGNQAWFQRQQITATSGEATEFTRPVRLRSLGDIPVLPDLRLSCLLGGRRLPELNGRCRGVVRRS
jgi:hypothetical protein